MRTKVQQIMMKGKENRISQDEGGVSGPYLREANLTKYFH